MPTPGDLYINATGDDQELVPAPGARQFIRVLHYHLSAETADQITFKSGSEVKDSAFLSDDGNVVMPEYRDGVFDCNPGENLNISGVAVGALKYTIKGQATL